MRGLWVAQDGQGQVILTEEYCKKKERGKAEGGRERARKTDRQTDRDRAKRKEEKRVIKKNERDKQKTKQHSIRKYPSCCWVVLPSRALRRVGIILAWSELDSRGNPCLIYTREKFCEEITINFNNNNLTNHFHRNHNIYITFHICQNNNYYWYGCVATWSISISDIILYTCIHSIALWR